MIEIPLLVSYIFEHFRGFDAYKRRRGMLALIRVFIVQFHCQTCCGLLSPPRRAKIFEKINYITN